MEQGAARICEDQDFTMLKNLITDDDGWSMDYEKNSTQVLTKNVEHSSFKMIKMRTVFNNVCASDLYDILHDPEYRKKWDVNALECVDIGYLNPNNDVSYYAMSCPPPLKNRDFVLQRSWLDTGQEQFIINHSVYHKDYPPKKGFIRAFSYLTGYYISMPRHPRGCHFSYVTRSDPAGAIPAWLVNKATQILAPKYVKLIESAALEYPNWKLVHDPNFKPWYHPDQISAPKITIEDCVPCEGEIQCNPQLKYLRKPSVKEKSSESSGSKSKTSDLMELKSFSIRKHISQNSIVSGNFHDKTNSVHSNLNKIEENAQPAWNRLISCFYIPCTRRPTSDQVVVSGS